MPDDALICDYCGEAAAVFAPPEGFVLDPNSLRYYQSEFDDNGTQWVTWFDAGTGQYEQFSYPATNSEFGIRNSELEETVTLPEPESEPELVLVPEVETKADSQPQIPVGFTHDPGSGLYYKTTPGDNPDTGESGQWTTWFYPQSGDYQRTFFASEPIPVSFEADPPSSGKNKKLLMILIPAIAIVIGLGIAFFFFDGFGLFGSSEPEETPDAETPVRVGIRPVLPTPPVAPVIEEPQPNLEGLVGTSILYGADYENRLYGIVLQFETSYEWELQLDDFLNAYVLKDNATEIPVSFNHVVLDEYVTIEGQTSHFYFVYFTEPFTEPGSYAFHFTVFGESLYAYAEIEMSFINLNMEVFGLFGRSNAGLIALNGPDNAYSDIAFGGSAVVYYDVPSRYPGAFWLENYVDANWLFDDEFYYEVFYDNDNQNVWTDDFIVTGITVWRGFEHLFYLSNSPITLESMTNSFPHDAIDFLALEDQYGYYYGDYGSDVWLVTLFADGYVIDAVFSAPDGSYYSSTVWLESAWGWDTPSDEQQEAYPAPVFTRAHASATLAPAGSVTYDPMLVLDGRADTAWAFEGRGGQWIELVAGSEQHVSGIRIMNGYNKYSDSLGDWLYFPNNRPRDIVIEFSDGTSLNATLEDVFDAANHIFQDVRFDSVKITSSIRIYISSVYPGDLWNDTCISEIEVY